MKKVLAVVLALSSTACASILGISDDSQLPSVVTTTQSTTQAMFVVGDRVYYTGGSQDDLHSAAADGSGESSTTFNTENVLDLVTDGTTFCGKGYSSPAEIVCANLTTGNLDTIATFANAASNNPTVNLQGLTMHGGNVFWTAQSVDSTTSTLTSMVQYAPAQNGASPAVTTVYSNASAITATSNDPAYNFVAADDSSVYFTDNRGKVYSVVWSGSPKTNQAPVTLATDAPGDVSRFTVDSTNVYLATTSQSGYGSFGTIYAVPIGGGSTSTLIGDLKIASFVSDGAFVYITISADGTISKIPVSGGAPIELASGQTAVTQIDVDSKYLYWVTSAGPGGEESSTIYRGQK